MAGIRLGGGGVNSLIASPGLQKLAVPSPSSTTVMAAGCSRFKNFGLKKVSGSRRRPFRISAADVPDFLPATWYDNSVFIGTQTLWIVHLPFPVSQKLRLEPCNPCNPCWWMWIVWTTKVQRVSGFKEFYQIQFSGWSFLSMCATKSSGKSVFAAHSLILLRV